MEDEPVSEETNSERLNRQSVEALNARFGSEGKGFAGHEGRERREALRNLTDEAIEAGSYGEPAPRRSDVQRALDVLDDLMSASEPLGDDDLDAIDAWANNVQLDIMRHRRRQGGRRG